MNGGAGISTESREGKPIPRICTYFRENKPLVPSMMERSNFLGNGAL
jgi:hypothetical protein